MATLDPSVGGASANSYGTLAEALAYFANRPNVTTFVDDLEGDAQTDILVAATFRIDQEQYRGTKVSADQAREFPRSGIYLSGYVLPTDQIPLRVKHAQFEQALVLAKAGETDALAGGGTEGLSSLSVGPVKLDFRQRDPKDAGDNPAVTLDAQVYRLLRPWLITATINEQRYGTTRLTRG